MIASDLFSFRINLKKKHAFYSYIHRFQKIYFNIKNPKVKRPSDSLHTEVSISNKKITFLMF